MDIRCLGILPWLAAGLSVFASDAWSVCQVPQPRVACAEYANSQAVVIAKLVSIREVVHDDDIDGRVYTLAVSRRLKGQTEPNFQVWEENSSGRATFEWRTGIDYLLFAAYSNGDHAWVIDGCGNSGPLSLSAPALAAIESMKASAAEGVVEGMASTDSWRTGVRDVTIRAIGNGATFTTRTDQDGRFRIELPVGRYKMDAIRSGWSFAPIAFSYENPSDLTVTRGGCAQVQFGGTPAK